MAGSKRKYLVDLLADEPESDWAIKKQQRIQELVEANKRLSTELKQHCKPLSDSAANEFWREFLQNQRFARRLENEQEIKELSAAGCQEDDVATPWERALRREFV